MMRDALAGIAAAGLLLPSAIAYAAIAGLAPEHAIIATLAGLAAYAVAGRSRFAMVAPTSSSATILAAMFLALQGQAPASLVAAAAVLAAAACFLLAGVLRAGALASFISRPVLDGFILGIALTITLKQLATFTGLSAGSRGTLPLLVFLACHAGQWHGASVALGAASLIILAALRRWRGLPASALVLACGIGLSYMADLPAQGIRLAGALALQLPVPAWPALSLDNWTRVAELALPLFLILFAESWGSIRGLALRHGDAVNPNRELLALGAANLCSGLLQGMPVGAGFSAASAAEASSAQSRLAGLAALACLLLLLLAAPALVARIPAPVLAAVVIASLFHALNPAPLLRLWRIRRDEIVATAAVAAVLLLGVLDGMLAAVGFSLLALLRRMAATRVVVLGRIPGGQNYADAARHAQVELDPDILVLRPAEPLFFANAEGVCAEIFERAAAGPARLTVVSLEESFDLDSTALDALLECDARLGRAGRKLILARVKDPLRDVLAAAGDETLARERCFRSVSDAVEAARMISRQALF